MNVAIVLSGGTGSRLGADIPKQYISVAGKQIISYSLEVIAEATEIDAIVIVAASEWQSKIELPELLANKKKPLLWALSGENRQLSIYNGMKAAAELEPTAVLIHDAARPLISTELIARMFKAFLGCEGVMPALPMKDTIYMVCEEDETIQKTLPRQQLAAGQAPELFAFEPYMRSIEALLPDKILLINGSSEPAIMAGLRVITIAGDEMNFKITTEADLKRFKEIIGDKG